MTSLTWALFGKNFLHQFDEPWGLGFWELRQFEWETVDFFFYLDFFAFVPKLVKTSQLGYEDVTQGLAK